MKRIILLIVVSFLLVAKLGAMDIDINNNNKNILDLPVEMLLEIGSNLIDIKEIEKIKLLDFRKQLGYLYNLSLTNKLFAEFVKKFIEY